MTNVMVCLQTAVLPMSDRTDPSSTEKLQSCGNINVISLSVVYVAYLPIEGTLLSEIYCNETEISCNFSFNCILPIFSTRIELILLIVSVFFEGNTLLSSYLKSLRGEGNCYIHG